MQYARFAQEESMANLSNLTPRELDVLRFVLSGWTNKAIAREIHICEKTVEFHLDNAYTKLVYEHVFLQVFGLSEKG